MLVWFSIENMFIKTINAFVSYFRSSASNEMCNLYLMYYTEYHNALAGQSLPCVGIQYNELVDNLPSGNDEPLPPNPELEQQAYGHDHHHHTSLTYNTFPDRADSSLGYNRANRLNDIASDLRVKPNANGAFNNEYSKFNFLY